MISSTSSSLRHAARRHLCLRRSVNTPRFIAGATARNPHICSTERRGHDDIVIFSSRGATSAIHQQWRRLMSSGSVSEPPEETTEQMLPPPPSNDDVSSCDPKHQKQRIYPLVINPFDDLDNIYSSPMALLSDRNEKRLVYLREIECEDLTITINGTKWYTAAYETKSKFSSGIYYSGTLFDSKLLKKLKSTLATEEYCTVNDRTYYKSKDVAREAAAARILDSHSYKMKTNSKNRRENFSIVPLRYCAEEPEKYFSENIGVKLERYAFLLHVPMSFMQKFFLTDCKNFYRVEEKYSGGKKWHTATLTDPYTSEVFASGLVGPINVMKKYGATLKPSFDEVDVRIYNGKVYYEDVKLAKHAAAARAIDCYVFREGGGGVSDDNNEEANSTYRLCLEEPYNSIEEYSRSNNDYGELLRRRQVAIDKKLNNTKPKATTTPRYDNYDAVAFLDSQKQKNTMKPKQQKQQPPPKKSFQSLAENFSFQLHSPLNFLENCYGQIHGSIYPKESFQADSITVNERQWYTATFTDPFTSEVFSSGLAQVPINAEKRHRCFLVPPLGEADVHIMDDKVYYVGARFAKHAAAARAIDCYLHREGGSEKQMKNKYRLCLEEPYSDIIERYSDTIDYDELLRRRNLAIDENRKPIEEYFSQLHVPTFFLSTYFRERYGDKYKKKSFGIESIEIGRTSWYTCSFTDSNTGEVFPAGIVGPIDAEKGDIEERYYKDLPRLDEADVRIVDGKVYYARKQNAKHAAAARAIDCYLYRDGNSIGETPKHQLCLEEPYNQGETKEIDYHALVASRKNASFVDALDSADDSNLFLEDMMPHLEESDKDFSIVSLSFSDDQLTKVDQNLSTLGRIAEIWAETSIPIEMSTSAGKAMTESASFTKVPKVPTENILSWFKRVDHTPTNFEQAIAFSHLCHKVLVALANENKDKALNLEYAEIQGEAKSILDKMMSISSKFAGKDESFVEAETLNAYIQCLSRIDAEESAIVAERLLKRMSEGKDNLPLPNTKTFNAVMTLWSIVDGEKGQYGVNDTFSLLQNATAARGDIRPNRDTFRILLAANARENNHFKYDLALTFLERIKSLSQDLCGETFTPKANDYNAALKTAATKCLVNDDYYPQWFWHGKQYDGGFKAIDDDKKCEALEMEKWLEHAEAMGAGPSEEMYSEVIKAWTKTGSLIGLIGGDGAHGAEELAKKAVVRIEGAPNMKMFYPIIAAWSLCGEKLGPERVKEWIDQLSSLGMKPDLDIQVAYFAAVEKWQSKLIANIIGNDGETVDLIKNNSAEVASTDGDIDLLFKAAQSCSKYLEEMTSVESRRDIADLDYFTSILRYTIKAWSRASHSTLLLPHGSTHMDTAQGVEEMANVLKHTSLRSISGQDSAEIHEAVVKAAGKVYTEFISQLCNIDSIMNKHSENNQECFFASRIADVESSLRSYEFHSRRLASSNKLSPECRAIRHSLYKETLRGCAGVKSSTDYGHVMRICALVMDCLAWHHELLSRSPGDGKDVEDVTHIYSDVAIISGSFVKNPYERMNVLTSIYDRARDFFPKENSHIESSYARVDRATLLGSMRRAMGDSEMTDHFIRSFEDEKHGKRKRSRQRGNI